MHKYFARALYILTGSKKQLVSTVLLILFTSIVETIGIGLVGPFIALATNQKLIYSNPWFNRLYTYLQLSSEVQFISIVGLAIVTILCLKSLLGFHLQKHIFAYGFSQQSNLRLRLMHAYLTVPYSFHLNRNTALLIENIITETENFANRVLMPVLFSSSNLVVIFALSLLLISMDFYATASIFTVIAFVSLILYQFKDKLSRWGYAAFDANTEIIRIINHALGGFKETRLIGCESYFENQMAIQAVKYKESVSSSLAFSLLPRQILEPLIMTFLVGFTVAYLFFHQSPENLSSTLGVFGMASIRLLPAISNLMGAVAGLKQCGYIVDQLYLDLKEIRDVEPSIAAKKDFKHIDENSSNSVDIAKAEQKIMTFSDRIALEKVKYRYPNTSDLVVNDISLSIKKGESIGLIGKSGSGKTTLVDIILGLLTPESGDIRVDNVAIEKDLRAWQNLIGYIPQSIFLIDDTIERNIAFGVSDDLIDQDKLNRAIQSAQLSEFINDLPEGMKTQVGERGVRLSGGQRQRIGIARVLYHEREILVLDEATSALDDETENLVTEAIKSLSGQKTMIIIAHRLSTIEHCDRIYKMARGLLVQSGSYQEVVLKDNNT
jgi:ATP-binding cassette, subfamily B, bacterial PglK